MIGIRNTYIVAAPVAFTTNIVPATVGLLSPIAANQTQKIRAWVPLSVGATGGIRVKPVVPAGGTVFLGTLRVNNTAAPSMTPSDLAANTAAVNALANAGTHWVEVEMTVVNGATAGNIDLQFAQDTSDALTMTVLQGGTMDVTIL